MNWIKLLTALFSFVGTSVLTYIGVPVIAVIFVVSMIIALLDLFIKKGDYRIDYSCMLIAIIICLLTGHINWGF